MARQAVSVGLAATERIHALVEQLTRLILAECTLHPQIAHQSRLALVVDADTVLATGGVSHEKRAVA